MIEGWQSKKWFNRKNKYFNISLRVPRNYGEEVFHPLMLEEFFG